MQQKQLTIAEHSLIRPDTSAVRPTDDAALVVDEAIFSRLKTIAGLPEAEGILTFFYRRGHETIKTGAYAGLIALPGGAFLEIVPRLPGQSESTGEDVGDHFQANRMALLRMLRHLRDAPFRTLTDAHLRASKLPLWTVFAMAFIDALTPLTQRGLRSAYRTHETNQTFVRGRFQPARQLRENQVHAERIAVAYETLSMDIPPNRILKSALLHVLGRVRNIQLETRLYQLLSVMHDVPESVNLPADLQAIQCLNRLFDNYRPALRWAELLLTGRAFGPATGETSALSLLFPMQRVFEEYVSHGFRAFWPVGEVSTQESSAHLVDEHGGAPRFRLRPDILVRHLEQTWVLDTKWKTIDATNRQAQYGIDSADFYQLFAYGKKYGASDVYLIYPASETFRTPLDVFGYDPGMRLHVLPFDTTQPLRQEVEKLFQYVSR